MAQLTQVELSPFFAVTGNAPSALQTADALLVSHIRYEGFQGNIRATTRPISLDAQAFAEIFEIPTFASWREQGGLTLSDDLGSRAMREFYAPGESDFYAHLVARDAFLAGNDLLYLGNIISSDPSDTYAATVDTLSFFAQKYREDSVFAQRVDEAVTRILTQKMRIYPYFSLGAVRPSISRLDELGQASQATFEVAQRSATIISPTLKNLDVVLPAHPAIEDQIVFITDTYAAAQCSLCPGEEILPINALPQSILRLYGEDAGGQALAGNLAAYSFNHLSEMLADEEAAFLESAIIQAEWVIISLAGVEQNQPEILRRFLSEKQELLRNKNIILFSFTAPYYLDATDISKLTAYYALYSTSPPFVDVAARLLYKELTPIGASPVSIAGIGYDLAAVTSPNPAQFISLSLDTPIEPAPAPADTEITPEPTQIPLFRVGDTLGVRTGIIVDHNNHSVPDGTVVTFTLTIGGDNGMQQQIETETTQGVARAAFQLNETGLLDIRAASEPAIVSETLRLDISSTGEAAITVIAPSVSQISTPVPDIQPIPTPIIQSAYVEDGSLRIGAWFFAALLWIFGALLAYWAGTGFHSTRWGIRWALSTLLGGTGAYNYLALDLPATTWITANGMFGVITFVLLGEILGLIIGWLWWKKEMGE